MSDVQRAVVMMTPVHQEPHLVDPAQPLVLIDDEGLTRGDGVFETMHALDGDVYKFGAHYRRLCASVRLAQLPVPSEQSCREAIELGLTNAGPGGDAGLGAEHAIKLSISRGAPGGSPWAWLTVTSVGESTFAVRRNGVSAVLLQRGHDPAEDSGCAWLLPGAKTLSYAVNMAALRHARDLGADEAIFTTSTDRRVLEAATSSVICARTGHGERTLVTPEPSHGILPGTSQARIFAAARHDGWRIDYGPIYPADLLRADAVWLTSSVRLAVPVVRLDQQPLPHNQELTDLLTGYLVGR